MSIGFLEERLCCEALCPACSTTKWQEGRATAAEADSLQAHVWATPTVSPWHCCAHSTIDQPSQSWHCFSLLKWVSDIGHQVRLELARALGSELEVPLAVLRECGLVRVVGKGGASITAPRPQLTLLSRQRRRRPGRLRLPTSLTISQCVLLWAADRLEKRLLDRAN